MAVTPCGSQNNSARGEKGVTGQRRHS